MTGNEMVGDISSPTSSSIVRTCSFPYYTVFMASFGYFIIGILIGWSSHIMYFLSVDEPEIILFHMFITICSVAAVIPLVVHKMLNGVSLKSLLILAAVFYLISKAMVLMENVIVNAFVMFSGCILDGLAVGALHFLIPIYLEDLMGGGSCKETRLRIDNILSIQMAIGVLTVYGSGTHFHDFIVFVFITTIPALIFVGLFFIPQSPRYLCNTNRSEEARQILQRFRGSLKNARDTKQIDADIDFWSSKQDKITFGTCFESVKSIKLLLSTLGLIFWEQMIGIVVIFLLLIPCLNYFYNSGIVESFIVEAGFIVGTLLAIFLRLKINQKYLLMTSGIIMGALLIILGIYDHSQKSTNRLNRNFGYFPAACFSAFLLLYAFGFRKSVSIYQHVLIERKKLFFFRFLRTSITWATVTFFVLIFTYGWQVLGLGWVLIFIGCINLLAVICIFVCVPSSITEMRCWNQEHLNNFENVPLDSVL